MFDRLFAIIGACGLLIAVTAMMPIEPAFAASKNCTEGNPGCEGDPVDGGTGEGLCKTEQANANACGGDNGCGCASVTKGQETNCNCQ
jgi:hypothetical protein